MPLWFRVVVFTVLVPGTVVGVGPWTLLRWAQGGRRLDPAGIGVAGVVLFAIGFAIYARCAWEFAARGGGTPAPYDPPRRLVVSGLYRHVRHPMYLAVLLMLAALAILGRSVPITIYAASFALSFHLRVRFWEEPALVRTFGDDYVRYCRNVPRWRPRLRGYDAAEGRT